MSDSGKDGKDAFFNSVKELETQHAICAARLEILNSVVRGQESVTFSVIDKCREAVLQFRQAHHVFKTVWADIKASPLAEGNMQHLMAMESENDEMATKASQALTSILSWVPSAVNTRASGPVARSE